MTTSVESNDAPKQHRWNDVGERCLDCGDKDWMNDPICRPRCAAPETTASPGICVSPSSVSTNAVPVDVLAILDIEIDAITLQVKRGSAPQHALHDMVAVRVAVAELIDKVDSYVTLGDSDTAHRELSAAIARVKGA